MFYSFARAVLKAVLLILRRWKVTGLSNVPQKGGLIVIANHTSYWDPVAVGCAISRPVNFMAKAELFKIPVFGKVIELVKAFPVHRGKIDRAALRKANELLKKGEVVGIFPEGTRSSNGELQDPHLGAVMLAVKNNVPVLPVAITGAQGVFNRIKLIIGEPISLPNNFKPSRAILEKYSYTIMNEVRRLIQTEGEFKEAETAVAGTRK